MGPGRSHTLAPLIRITSNNWEFKWKKFEQDAFEKIKQILARDTLSTYPYFDEMFKIYTNASAFQLRAVT